MKTNLPNGYVNDSSLQDRVLGVSQRPTDNGGSQALTEVRSEGKCGVGVGG